MAESVVAGLLGFKALGMYVFYTRVINNEGLERAVIEVYSFKNVAADVPTPHRG